jgi:hypothetical protein
LAICKGEGVLWKKNTSERTEYEERLVKVL